MPDGSNGGENFHFNGTGGFPSGGHFQGGMSQEDAQKFFQNFLDLLIHSARLVGVVVVCFTEEDKEVCLVCREFHSLPWMEVACLV